MDLDDIHNLEIPGLPPVLKTIERVPKRRVAEQNTGVLCNQRSRCGELKFSVYVYSLLQLFEAINFYKQASNHPYLIELLPGDIPTPYKIKQTCIKYFKDKGLEIPRVEEPGYLALEQNCDFQFFQYLEREYQLAATYTTAEVRPTTREEFDNRLRQIFPEQYYLKIQCCESHLEATIRHAVNGTWDINASLGRSSLPFMSDVSPDSLIYAPDSNAGIRVQLSADVAFSIVQKADQVERFFHEIALKRQS